MSQFSDMIAKAIKESNSSINIFDVAKSNNDRYIGTVVQKTPHGDSYICTVDTIIPNVSGPYEDSNGNTYYTCIDDKSYTTKARFIDEEYLVKGTQEDLENKIAECSKETEKWRR